MGLFLCPLEAAPGGQLVAPFRVDPDLTPEENIELFFEQLKESEPKLTGILLENLPKLRPLPPSGASRTAAREAFHKAVVESMDSGSGDQGDQS